MSPLGLGGLPAPSFQPLLNGRNHEALPFRCVQKRTSLVVHGEVDHAAAELEQQLARVAVALVLLDGVLDGLLGQAVLELERRDRQAVDEERQIERMRRLVAAVAKLAGDAENGSAAKRSAALALPGDGVP